MKRGIPLFVAVLVLLTGCGKFSKSGSPTTSTLLGDIGAGLPVDTTAAPTTVPTTSAKQQPVTTAAKAGCAHTDPSSEIKYEGKLRITLTSSKLCPQHADDVELTMTVANISGAALHYDQNQVQFFSINPPRGEGRGRWEDDDCANLPADRQKPAATLNAGQSLTLKALYPGNKDVTTREKCRKLEPGDYEVNGTVLVCEGDSYVDGYCNFEKDVQYKAAPVRITVES